MHTKSSSSSGMGNGYTIFGLSVESVRVVRGKTARRANRHVISISMKDEKVGLRFVRGSA